MAYVDAVVVPVPKRKLAAYRNLAQLSGKVWREHGALEYYECAADDVKPGKRTSFPQSVKLKPGETVVFAYVVYKSRAHRDRVMAKVMKHKVTDGPFAEAKEVLGGYWMIQVKSREEAIEWAKRCPASENETIEIRQVQEISDFPAENLPPKLGAREQELRDELERKAKKR